MTSLADLLDAGAPGDLAVHAAGTDHTRDEVRARADAVATALLDLGVGAGQPVGVMLPNGADLVATLFGVWRAGAVYVPLNPRLTATEIDRVLDAVRPAAVVVTAGDSARVECARVVVDHDASVVTVPGPVGDHAYGSGVALVQFTSGTTGRPKPVLLEHANVLELLDGVIATLRGRDAGTPPRAPMPNLVPVSLSLWAGIYQVLFAFRLGAPVVVMDRFDTQEFARLVAQFGIRSTVLPPAAMAMLADDAGVTSLEPLRYVRSISSPLSPFQARRFKDRFGLSILNCYGQTELGGEIVGWSAADARTFGDEKLGAAGRPHQGVEVRAVDATGQPLAPGDEGELWVRTPSMSAGYADGGADRADFGDRLTPDGWFRTGDIGRVDAEGFVWIDGRVSDMINRGGLKVYPTEVAEVVLADPAVADCAVAGVPDDRVGEVPWAFVVTAPGHELDPTALEARCREHVAPYKVPVRFVAVDELPRNEVGKVLTRELVARASAS